MRPDIRSRTAGRWWRRAMGSGVVLGVVGAVAYRTARRSRHARRLQRAPASVLDARRAITVRRAVTIRSTPEELYAFWRTLENLPRVMSHLASVTETSRTTSQWVAVGPAGARLTWDAEIVRDVPNEHIAWKSLDDGGGQWVAHAGSVSFRRVPADRGTELRVELSYEAPGAGLVTGVTHLFGKDPDGEIRDDLRRFKQSLEAGEITTAARRPQPGG